MQTAAANTSVLRVSTALSCTQRLYRQRQALPSEHKGHKTGLAHWAHKRSGLQNKICKGQATVDSI